MSPTLALRARLFGEMPREARDTLFLLGVIALILLPQVGHLPLWCVGLALAVLVWRGALALRSRTLPSLWWRAGLLVLALLATWASHRTLLGKEAGVTLVVVLLALKTLELRARRDAFVIFFLGFFAMLTNFFWSQSLLTAAAMLLALLGLLTALVNAHMPAGRPPLMQAARTAGWMALAGAPLMLALFMFFPRLSPLWGTPNDNMTGRSGLSNTMQVGTIASLVLDDTIAARVRFDDDIVPPRNQLYFRGPVLSQFDGREWRADQPWERVGLPGNLSVRGQAVGYEITLEPSNRPWLLMLDAVAQAPEVPGNLRVFQTPELQWLANRPLGDLLRLRAQSHLEFTHGPLRRVPSLARYTALPEGRDPQTRALAEQLLTQARAAQPEGDLTPRLVQMALTRLRTEGYGYTLEPEIYGENTADEFWFVHKAGFCEHIASAFAVLMRAAGVPARIVTGFQGGEVNPVDNYWTLRNSDAHAWAEVWQEGRGWVRVDPTGAISPERIGQFRRLAPQPGFMASAVGAFSPTLMQNLRASWEALNNHWNQWVLNYTQSRQLDLLKRLGFDSPSLADLAWVLLVLLAAGSLAVGGWALWERRRTDPWLRLLAQARARLAATGIELPPHAAPRQMAERLAREADAQAHAPLRDWLLRLEAWRYGREPSPAGLAALRRELQQIRPIRR
ncbi:DUF3488 and transglutaminase-like domain-containing protein [Xenophilus arseniciresistens]|uniref:DUF3488 and transglutaminase-like domain-containing protein n=1 Tax=Xenophilus arseniciresistens TaxID=1283306 RepID=A0AAE3T0H9_9BURK|nr:DUF3488 and transglutaminase-like domain-containing protein [Xenophilus arseniciresistens]MDA7416347.1 DUF3488 and transglutaminase-like domain-containing protein [Xenophilus arseniciresistens]